MNSALKISACALCVLALAACQSTSSSTGGASGSATATPSVSSSDLSGFVGAKGGQAEGGLRARGYELSRTEGLTAYWFNAGTGECAEIVTADGRYSSVTQVSAAECTGGSSASAPTAAEQACLSAVIRETNNADVALLGSSFSEAGTLVRVGVGPQRAPWQCIAYSDGTTAGVQFLGSG